MLEALRRSLFWVSAPIFFINFALPVKSKELGATAFEVGGLFSLFTFALLVFRPLIGSALDRIGRRQFLIVSLVLYVVAYIGYGVSESIVSMYLARLVQAVGAAILLLTIDAITTDLTSHQDRATAMGKNVEAQTRATFVGASVGFGLIAAFPENGWMISFQIFALMAAFALFVAIKSVPETNPVPTEQASSASMFSALMPLLLLLLPLGFASALAMPIYLVYLQDVFSPDVRLLSWAFLPAGIVFAMLPSKMGRIIDRFGPIRPTALALVGVAVLYGCMPLTGAFWPMVLVYTLTSVGWAVIEPARKAMTAKLAEHNTARAFGLAEMFYGFGAVAGPLAGGYLYDNVDKDWPFYMNGLIMMVALMLLMIVSRLRHVD